MSCEITIGKVKLNHVSAVTIKKSVKALADEAEIILPRNMQEVASKKSLMDFVKEKDEVIIKLGYNGQNSEEFRGYVKKINNSEPLKIVCEDQMYKLRTTLAPSGVYEKIAFKNFLAKVLGGVKFTTAIDLTIDKFIINKGSSVFDVLFSLKKDPYNMYSYFDTKGVLRVGFAYEVHAKDEVKTYEMQKHVTKNDLDYLNVDARNFRVKAVSNYSNGKKNVVYVGEADGVLRTLNFFNLTESDLKNKANAELKRMKFAGYSGKITGFGWPRTQAGTKLNIKDLKYTDRDGTYLIDAVTIRFNNQGFRRENQISSKI
ncbi:MAG: hypothetical protein K2Q03_05725 [Sphingobacteriaceae bacterium]|nr:hypothetical protein [Sphingobacteriaceae bacterium]